MMTRSFLPIKLGIFAGLCFAVALMVTPAKADVVRGWVAGTGDTVKEIARGTYNIYLLDEENTVTATPKTVSEYKEAGYKAGAGAYYEPGSPAEFTLNFTRPVDANADGYLLSLIPITNLFGANFTQDELDALFESVEVVSGGGTWDHQGWDVVSGALTLWFSTDEFGDAVSFVFKTASGSLPLGAFVAKISETSTNTPEPATLAILGLGLAGLGVVRRRRK